MKIVVISEWFSENMGYAENLLPAALGKLGHDVNVVTSTAQVYYNSLDYSAIYEPFLGPNIVYPCVKPMTGYTLHRLPHYDNEAGLPGIVGLETYLHMLDPDIIQTFEINSDVTLDAAKYIKKANKKLFTESHIHKSVFDGKRAKGLKELLKYYLKFRPRLNFINRNTRLCYPIAKDVAELAVDYFLVQEKKIRIQSLGVNTDIFNIVDRELIYESRNKLRKELGFSENDFVCIYTGRFSKAKNPHNLALAVNYLQEKGNGHIKALFIGNGKKEDVDYINSKAGCFIRDFVPVTELPQYYWAADIGVWPSQESTSQLDAAACGLPLILSDKIKVLERVDGNGLLYEENNYIDMADKILQLINPQLREEMANLGAMKIRDMYSWDSIAKKRSEDYIKY